MVPTDTYSGLLTAPEGSGHLFNEDFPSWSPFSWVLLAWLSDQGDSFAPEGKANSELVLRSHLRAQIRVGIHLQASNLRAMTSSCRTEAVHFQQAHKMGQLPSPLASVLTSGLASHICTCSPGLILSFRLIYPDCILHILTQMISKLTCPKLNSCSYSPDMPLCSSSLAQHMIFPSL